MPGVLIKKKRRFGHRERHAQRKDDIETQEEHYLQAKGLTRLPEARREAWSTDSLTVLRSIQPCGHLDFSV